MHHNTVVVIQYKRLEFLPPVMALLLSLKENERSVYFIGVWSSAGESFLIANQIPHAFLPYKRELYLNNSFIAKITHRIERAIRFFPCRKALRQIVTKVERNYGMPTLWFADTQSAGLMGNVYRNFPHCIVSIFEMAERGGAGWWGFDLNAFMHRATLVLPEYNRAFIFKEYYKLNTLPSVVVNKTAGHPRKSDIPLPKEAKIVFEKIGNRPVFLYQGVWTKDRKDLGMILVTIAKKRPDYCVLMMPSNEAIRELLSPYENAFSLPYIAPPNHLAVTSRATVGIAVYNSADESFLDRVNSIYCAPNKIYEYAGFGIPTLGNNIPGLKYTIEASGAGVCCDINEASILRAADELVVNIDAYRARANRFFDETDLNGQVNDVLKKAEEKYQ